MSLIPYLHLKQGHGGLYTMPHVSQDTNGSDQTLRWIGSRGCFTCVCIYIPLSQNEVFAAHIDSHTGEHNRPIDWIPETAEESELLKAYIHKRLAEKLPFLANGEYASNPLRSKAIILCPRRELWLDGTFKMRATGWSVVEAVREFFRFTPDSRGTHFAHGFIVNPSTGERHMLKYQSDEANEDLQDRLDQLKHKEKDTMVPRDHEELQQHSERLRYKMPEEYGFKEVPLPEADRCWTLMYDRDQKQWGIGDPSRYER